MTSKSILQLKDKLAPKLPTISFEFFPTKTPEAREQLESVISQLSPFNPTLVSVTYGAGGSSKDATYETIEYIKNHTGVVPAAHLTCVSATKDEINEVAQKYLEIGVNHIIALRGDVPGMKGEYVPTPGGYAYADQLVTGLKKLGNFDITVAAYPEKHPQASSLEADIEHLKRKQDAGADRAVMQYCFDNDVILRFVEKARKAGVTIPIIPGIMPIYNFQQSRNFSQRCGADVPKWLVDLFDGTEDNAQLHNDVALSVALEQCRFLIQEGFESLHFYTLNRSELIISICQLLGIKAQKS
ncbi:methylenetetrahydrofolate reductase [NAD(P)H] [Rickettsiales bacterium]|nr:methylenetetrahydrofolate reductase [NAD(P)H] [Rickettsiales bacterium]